MTSLLLWLACGQAPTPCVADAPVPDAPRAAGCVVVTEAGLLLVRGPRGWSIPGGHLDPPESSADAAVRETLEEAGVPVVAKEPFCVAERTAFVAHRCELRASSARPRADRVETFEARFVSLEELSRWSPDQFRFPDQVDAYRRALTTSPDRHAR